MPDLWCFYHIKNCLYTQPPKNKFVAIVCFDLKYMGFFINSNINPFIKKRAYLLSCQVTIPASDYWFLPNTSHLDCSRLYSFNAAELIDGRELIKNKTQIEIKKVVSTAVTIEEKYQKLILGF